MRLRGAGARIARLLLAFFLLVGSFAISPGSPGESPTASPRSALAKADHHHARQAGGAAKRHAGQDHHKVRENRDKSARAKSQAGDGSGGQQAAQDENPLDADAIAAANAGSVAALDCGDLEAIHVGIAPIARTARIPNRSSRALPRRAPPGSSRRRFASTTACLVPASNSCTSTATTGRTA